LPGDGGYLLHAQYLKFDHPITGERIHLEAALPSGFSLHGYVHDRGQSGGNSETPGRAFSECAPASAIADRDYAPDQRPKQGAIKLSYNALC
jgi:hypothetical protein